MSSVQDEPTLLSETDAANERLDRDDVFHILQCRRRRLVLKYLQEHDGPADMRDITERIAAVENDTSVAQLRSQERQRVYIALYQSHLPKMDRDGIINYEQDRGVVERTACTAQFDPYLVNEPDLLPESDPVETEPAQRDAQAHVETSEEDDWKRRSLVAAGGGLALVASIYAGTVQSIPAVAIAALACVLVVAAVGVYYRGGSGPTADA